MNAEALDPTQTEVLAGGVEAKVKAEVEMPSSRFSPDIFARGVHARRAIYGPLHALAAPKLPLVPQPLRRLFKFRQPKPHLQTVDHARVADAAVHLAKERTMKTRLFIVLLVVIGLLAAMSSAAAAQAPSGDGRPGFAPAFAPGLTGPNVEPEPSFDPEAAGRGGIRSPVCSHNPRLRLLLRRSPSASRG